MELTETGLIEIELQGVEGEKIDIIDEDSEIELIVKALSSKTRREILRYIRGSPKDVSNIAKTLDMTEANISAQINRASALCWSISPTKAFNLFSGDVTTLSKLGIS